jgi:hypothetical protein
VTSADAGRIHWNAKTRALVEPHQRSPGVAAARPPDVEAVVATLKGILAQRAGYIRAALPAAEERFRQLALAVLDTLDHPAAGWLKDSAVELDAARSALIDVECRGAQHPFGGTTHFGALDEKGASLDLWTARGGLAHAVEMLVRSHAYELVYRSDGLCLEAAENWPIRYCAPSGIWLDLRKRLTVCADGEYESCRHTADSLRRTVPLHLRCSLAYVFPQETSWATEDAARVISGEPSGDRGAWLLACLRDPAQAEGVVAVSDSSAAALHLHTMLDLLGPAGALPLGTLISRSRRWAMAGRHKLANQMATIESPRASSFFAANLTDSGMSKAGKAYLERHADLGLPALREAAAAGSPGAADLLARLERTPAGGPGTRDATVPADAEPEDLPGVLAEPPWKGKRKAAPAPAVISPLPLLPAEESIVWKPGERDYMASGRAGRHSIWVESEWPALGDDALREREAESFASFEAALRRNQGVHLKSLFHLTDALSLSTWNSFPSAKYEYFDPADLHRVLARHGLLALPGFFAFAEVQRALVVEVLARVRSPRVAGLMATAHAELTRGRRIATQWLNAFPREAAIGLIPDAVGEPGTARRHAEAALRVLAGQGHIHVVRAVAAAYGSEAGSAVADVLAHDPYLQFPRRLPDLSPLSFTPELWPRPRLRASGQDLSDAAVQALGTMLAFTPADDPYPGIADVKRACDARSLADFAWALFQSWIAAGAPAKGEWAFGALSLLGDEGTAEQLWAEIEPWSSGGRYGRAVTAVRALAAMDSDAALAGVRRLAEKAKSRPLRKEARQQLVEAADRRGLTADQLSDLLVPDLVVEGDGTKLAKPVKMVLKAETARLERAMTSRRRWEAAEFRRVIVPHPVLGWLARRLVWGVYDDATLAGTFRVAEDLTFADSADRAWTLPGGASVGVAHRTELAEPDCRAWASLLADYELVQPFPQLDREVFRPAPDEMGKLAIEAAAGSVVTARRLLSLESRGWDRPGGKDIFELVKPVPWLEREACLPLDPGLFAGDLFASDDQKLGGVTVRRPGSESEADCVTIGEMGTILYSELVRDLLSLRR